MLIPRRVKYRKQHRPGRKGMAKGGTEVAFGEWGLQATTRAYVTNRQIEAARIAMTRYIKRGGHVWINIFPDRPLTKKPAEVRMGLGSQRQTWPCHVRTVWCHRRGRSRSSASGCTQAASQGSHCTPRGW